MIYLACGIEVRIIASVGSWAHIQTYQFHSIGRDLICIVSRFFQAIEIGLLWWQEYDFTI